MKFTIGDAVAVSMLFCLIINVLLLLYCDAKYQPKQNTDYQLNVTQQSYIIKDGDRVVHTFHWGDNPKLEETIDIDNQ